jgi:hypothetical protein
VPDDVKSPKTQSICVLYTIVRPLWDLLSFNLPVTNEKNITGKRTSEEGGLVAQFNSDNEVVIFCFFFFL